MLGQVQVGDGLGRKFDGLLIKHLFEDRWGVLGSKVELKRGKMHAEINI